MATGRPFYPRALNAREEFIVAAASVIGKTPAREQGSPELFSEGPWQWHFQKDDNVAGRHCTQRIKIQHSPKPFHADVHPFAPSEILHTQGEAKAAAQYNNNREAIWVCDNRAIGCLQCVLEPRRRRHTPIVFCSLFFMPSHCDVNNSDWLEKRQRCGSAFAVAFSWSVKVYDEACAGFLCGAVATSTPRRQ